MKSDEATKKRSDNQTACKQAKSKVSLSSVRVGKTESERTQNVCNNHALHGKNWVQAQLQPVCKEKSICNL